MAKNVFIYLNWYYVMWVDILYLKYGKINFPTDSYPSELFLDF